MWPLVARAQRAEGARRIGVLYPGPEAIAKLRSVLLLMGLASQGLREPDQITLLTRATGGDSTQITPLLTELLASKVDLLIPSGPAVTRAAYAATKSLPIVTFDLERRLRGPYRHPTQNGVSRSGDSVTKFEGAGRPRNFRLWHCVTSNAGPPPDDPLLTRATLWRDCQEPTFWHKIAQEPSDVGSSPRCPGEKLLG
jgi:hypothetical protein